MVIAIMRAFEHMQQTSLRVRSLLSHKQYYKKLLGPKFLSQSIKFFSVYYNLDSVSTTGDCMTFIVLVVVTVWGIQLRKFA